MKDYSGTMLFAVTHASPGQVFYGHEVHDLQYYIDDVHTPVIVTVKPELRDELKEYALNIGFESVLVPDIKLDDYEYLSQWQELDLESVLSEWYETYTGKVVIC